MAQKESHEADKNPPGLWNKVPVMRIFDAIEFLPRPTIRLLAPSVVAFAVFLLLDGLPVAFMGQGASVVGLAATAGLMLLLARNAPFAFLRARQLGALGFFTVIVVTVPIAALSAALWLTDTQIQLLWMAALAAYAFLSVILALSSSDAEIQRLPTRWSDDPVFARAAINIQAVVWAGLVVLAADMYGRAALADWVAVMTLGNIAAYYLRELLVIMIVMRSYD